MYLVSVFLGGFPSYLGVGPCAESPRKLSADLYLDRGVARRELLGVGIGYDELHPFHSGGDHPVDSVSSRAPDADDFDYRGQLFFFF